MIAGIHRQFRNLSGCLVGIVVAALPSIAFADTPPEPLPKLNRKIVPISIVKTKTGFVHLAEGAKSNDPPAKIISVHGRSATDLWFLTEDAVLLHDDGKRIVDRYVKPCGWGEFNREFNGVGTHVFQVVTDKDAVHVIGEERNANSRVGSEVYGSLGKDGKWSCKGNSAIVPALAVSGGDTTWRVGHNMDNDACRIRASNGFCTSGPRWAPSFVEPVGDTVDMGIHTVALWMLGVDDGFAITMDEAWRGSLHRFNGVTWAPIAKIDSNTRISDLWADEERHAWIVAGGAVLHYDGRTVKSMGFAASVGARAVRGTGARDVFFLGDGNMIFQWDGARFREGQLAFEPSDLWAAPGGEVWFVGPDGVAVTAPLSEGH